MSNERVKVFRNYAMPETEGSHHRLLCMTGKNKGLSYVFSKKRVVLGRGNKVEIQVYDNKSSREHAELVLVENQYFITDLGSQNGVYVNDLKITQHQLSDGDVVVIGKTVYKYNILKVEKQLIISPEDKVMEHEEDELSVIKPGKERKKNKKLLLYACIVLGILMLLPTESEKENKKSRSQIGPNEHNATPMVGAAPDVYSDLDPEVREKLEAYIHRGQREFREGNFFRAIEQFNLALILSPSDGPASFYLERTKQRLDEHIVAMFEKAARDVDALKFKSSMITYCSIISFLSDYPDDKRYLDAQKRIEVLEEKLGMVKGEFKCL